MYQYSSQMYGTEWESYMGITNLAKVVSSEQLCVDPTKSPFNIVTTPLQTPPGFCATRSLVSFQAQQHDQIEVPAWCFEFPKTTTTTTTIDSGDNFTSTKQDLPSSQFTSSLLCPVAESFLSNDKLLRDDAATDERPLEISFQRNQLVSCRKREKQGPRQHCGGACLTSSNSAFRRGKRRIKWTKDLHEPFMMIVKSLGGPEKAKPKAILEMMKSDLLSISHVKSHLQKCRSTIHMHKDLQVFLSERSEEGHKTDEVAELQVKIQMQIEESRQLQLEVRRNICQQLEMQRNLQVLIEQQSQQLKVMLDYQKERTKQEKNP
ncbi:protein PHOSPHATE STARVATION RESPONSE 1 isoform X3 [Cajanus cajan]|uniref:protein PHOSPHATE STARVATION RESPONSE 1 isoform X3 n=1 Tax=Cajanus cajan TaxID=3821 RepID=UPI00098D880D|nr:protein PHOSPHATE STARVATION RESPONSE 1 isoform X3 [Cajanus cajan]